MKKLLLLLVVLFSLSSKAQVTLGMNPNFHYSLMFHTDTVSTTMHDSIGVWVKNYGPDNFSGYLGVVVAARDSITPAVLDTIIISPGNPVSIPNGDSTMVVYTTSYNNPPYRAGIDVIVVWPIAYSDSVEATIGDSLEFTLYVIFGTGIHELDIRPIIKLYPNPGTDRITIEDPENNKAVETVTIYDQSGKMVVSEKEKSVLNIEELAPGIYHAEVYLSDKKHYSIQFIKQK